MKKRILSFVLVFSILSTLIVALPITASAETSGTCGDNLTWTLDDSGTLTISGTGAMTDYWYSGAPWYSLRESITSATISDGVTSIGDYAFSGCSSLESITIGNSVTCIGGGVFRCCSSLESITIGNSVTCIGDYAFGGCSSLESITIGNSVTSIGEWAFSGCSNLKNVYYSGTYEQWKEIAIDSQNTCLTNATIHYNSNGPGMNSNNSNPFTSQANTDKNGTTDFDLSSNISKPYYINVVKNNSSINGDYTIKDSNVTVSSGKILNISGKLTI